VTFARLTRGDWLAAVAALALLLVMALDWYSTEAGDEARRDEKLIQPRGATAGEVSRALDESARIDAEEAEQNAWQADPWPDRVILIVLLAAVALAIAAAWLRAAGVRFKPPWTPSALAAGTGLAAAVLLAARILQKPGVDPGAVVKIGAPLGLVCVGTIVLGARSAWNAERDGSAWGEGPAEPEAEGEDHAVDHSADTDEHDAVAKPKPPPLFDHTPPADAEPEAATATATRPVTTDPDEDDEPWAPDWSDPTAPAPEPGEDQPKQRRRRGLFRRRRT
jgi:hypothetical protein